MSEYTSEYTCVSTPTQIDPTFNPGLRYNGNLYDFMSHTAGIELCDMLIPSIPDQNDQYEKGYRQIARELINEEIVDDTDLPELESILETVEGGNEWCKKNIKIIITNSINFSIQLDNIDKRYCDFIIQLTSNSTVMKGVKGGDIWGYEKPNKFIEWCIIETTQPKTIRTNYYYLIRQYGYGTIDPIGIVGIRQVNKQNNRLKNQRNNKNQNNSQTSINYNLDVFISPEYHNYGYGSCAIRKCLELYWMINPDRQVTINIPVGLNNMIKIATNLGATMEKTFKTGRSTFLKYVISKKTIIWVDNDYLYLPPAERRVIISRRARK